MNHTVLYHIFSPHWYRVHFSIILLFSHYICPVPNVTLGPTRSSLWSLLMDVVRSALRHYRCHRHHHHTVIVIHLHLTYRNPPLTEITFKGYLSFIGCVQYPTSYDGLPLLPSFFCTHSVLPGFPSMFLTSLSFSHESLYPLPDFPMLQTTIIVINTVPTNLRPVAL